MGSERFIFKRIILIMLGFVIFLFQSPVFVFASGDQAKTVRVGYYENEIFQEGASDGAIKYGYAYEYYRKLSEYTGWKYEYVYGSYNDLYQMLIDGDIDMLAGIAYREDRESVMSYPDLPMGTESYVLVKHDTETNITSDPETISGHTIGVLDSNMSITLKDYLIRHNIDAKVVLFDNTAKLLDSFDSGQVDILAAEGDGTNVREHAEVIMAYASTDYYICVNKQQSELLQELNDAQNHLFTDEPYYLSMLNAKFFASSLSSVTLSEDERAWIRQHNTITIGYLNNYLPYSDTGADGQVDGVVKDVFPKLFDSLRIDDITVKYKGFDNFDDMIAAINDSSIDAAFPVAGGFYYSEESGIYQTHSLLSSSTDLIYKNVVIYPDNSSFAINSNNKMQYYYVKTNYPNADVIYYDSIEECLQAVLNGEVDCTTLNGVRANSILKNVEYEELSLRQLTAADDRCIGVKIGNEGLLRMLNRGIHIMGSDYVENQAYKYVDGLYTTPPPSRAVVHLRACLIAVLLALFAVTVVLIYKLKKCNEIIEHLKSSNDSNKMFINNLSTVIREPVREIAESSENTTGRQLLNTIDNIINMSLFENGGITLQEDNINISQLIKNIEESLSDIASGKKIELVFEKKDIKNKDIITDEARLTQALTNILTNAIKYSQKGKQVHMDVEEQKSSNPRITNMIFTIKDHGIGMSEEFQKKAFDAYAREDSSIDGAQGAGLGLTIANYIVNLMGGNITLKSIKDTGSEFIVKVPVKINYKI